MKKFSIYNLLTALFLSVSALALSSCAADEEIEAVAPTIETGNATEITRTGAILSGEITCDIQPEEFGIAWSTVPDIKMSLSSTQKVACTGDVRGGKLAFSASISNLKNGNTYYYRTYSFNGVNYALGEVRSFTTAENSGPSFDKITVTGSNESLAQVTTKLTEDGGAAVMLTGFIYKNLGTDSIQAKSATPIAYGQNDVQIVQVDLDNQSNLAASINELQPNHYYAIRAFGVSAGLGYSEQIVVHTAASETPTLSECNIRLVGDDIISMDAQIVSRGTSDIEACGFVYSIENQQPTIQSSNNIAIQANNNVLSSELAGIELGRTYFIRAYATNAAGTAYGPVFTFNSEEKPKPVVDPIVYTITASDVTSSSAILYGVVALNDNEVALCGFYINGIPYIVSDSHVSDGPYNFKVENLSSQTSYRYQAFIESNDGKLFVGRELEFTTTKLTPSFDDQKFPEIQ